MSPDRLRIATRRSPLALWQARRVAALLARAWPGIETPLVEIVSEGDRNLTDSLPAIGGKGLFTSALEDALRQDHAELAVHSLKDLPTTLPEGMTLAAVPERASPRDALIAPGGAQNITQLPHRARVATGSLRRRAQLLHLRPDLQIGDLRGNLGTRLQKLHDEGWDAMILAQAGLERLGIEQPAWHPIPPAEFLPAVGQAALGIEARSNRPDVLRHLAAIDQPELHRAVRAERALLARLEGGCHAPIGALAELRDDRLHLEGLVGDPEGRQVIRERLDGDPDAPEALGRRLAETLLERGADAILEALAR